jgi:hypothetical protein
MALGGFITIHLLGRRDFHRWTWTELFILPYSHFFLSLCFFSFWSLKNIVGGLEIDQNWQGFVEWFMVNLNFFFGMCMPLDFEWWGHCNGFRIYPVVATVTAVFTPHHPERLYLRYLFIYIHIQILLLWISRLNFFGFWFCIPCHFSLQLFKLNSSFDTLDCNRLCTTTVSCVQLDCWLATAKS